MQALKCELIFYNEYCNILNYIYIIVNTKNHYIINILKNKLIINYFNNIINIIIFYNSKTA